MGKIIQSFKSFEAISKYHLLGKKSPLVLSLLVTNKCNFNCAFCWVDPQIRKMPDMPFTRICKIIDDFYDIGMRIIWIEGGEPLLRDDIDKIVDYIKAKGIFCEIVTNGWLAEQKMDTLLKADKVCFSIDGDETSHDKVRRKGSHRRIISALKKGRQLRLNFRLHAVLNLYNMTRKSIDYLCDLAERMETSVSFTYAILPVQKLKAKRDSKEHYFKKAKLQDILRYILKCKKQGKPIHHTEALIKRVIDWNLPYDAIGYKHNLPKRTPQCLYGRLAGFLDVDGMLYPCTKFFGYENKGMSVIKHGARKAWDTVSNLDCVACGKLSELNSILSINPINIIKVIKDYLK